jgi:hypothetical protein
MLPFVMGMQCQSVVNMLLMTLRYVVECERFFIKDALSSLQKIITWILKSGKGKHEWDRACKDASFCPQKLKTPMKTRFASKIILFKETLEFKDAINLCYSRPNISLQSRIPIF